MCLIETGLNFALIENVTKRKVTIRFYTLIFFIMVAWKSDYMCNVHGHVNVLSMAQIYDK